MTTMINPIWTQLDFRGRNDDGTQTAATWKANLNTNWTQTVDQVFRVRLVITETAGANQNNTPQFTLQYNLNNGGWLNVGTSTPVFYTASAHVTDDTATTQQISSGTFTAGRFDSDGTHTALAAMSNSRTEMEWSLRLDGAVVGNDANIQLRAVLAGGTLLNNYTNTPSITAFNPITDITVPSIASAEAFGVPTLDYDIGSAPQVVGHNILRVLDTGIILPRPTGVIEGREILVVIAGAAGVYGLAVSAPLGFEGGVFNGAGQPDILTAVFWKTATANEPTTYRFYWDLDGEETSFPVQTAGFIASLANVKAQTPLYNFTSNGYGKTLTTADLNSSYSSAFLVGVFGTDGGESVMPLSQPVGMNIVAQTTHSLDDGPGQPGLMVAVEHYPSAGWVGTRSSTHSSPTLDMYWVASILAFEPEEQGAGLNIQTSSIPTAEAFDQPIITAGAVSLSPTSIPTAEAFGAPQVEALSGALDISPNSIPTAEAFDAPAVTLESRVLVDWVEFRVPASDQLTLYPPGIPSAEAFGTPEIVAVSGAQDVYPTSIPTAEAFGEPLLAAGAVDLYPTAIPTGEAFDNPAVIAGAVAVSPTSIPTAEAFESPAVLAGAVSVYPQSIPTAEAFGEPLVAAGASAVYPQAVPSAEAFGEPVVAAGGVALYPQAISSAEAFDQPALIAGTVDVSPTSIPSAEAFDQPAVQAGAAGIYPQSVPSEEAFGQPALTVGAAALYPQAIPSGEAFDQPAVNTGQAAIYPAGIASGEAFGAPTLEAGGVYIWTNGIASAEAFDSPVLSAGPVAVAPQSIPSAEAFGVPAVAAGGTQVYPASIPSAEAFDNPSVQVGAAAVVPQGIPSAEQFDQPVLAVGSTPVYPQGIPSGEAFDQPVVAAGGYALYPQSIGSAEAFGNPSLTVGPVQVQPQAIPSAEAFGEPIVSGAVIVAPPSIASAEAFGQPSVYGVVDLYPASIPSAEAFGEPTLTQTVAPFAISSAEAFGEPLFAASYAVGPASIPSAEAFGFPAFTQTSFLRPDGVIQSGGWTDQNGGTENLHLSIDQPDDLTYIRHGQQPAVFSLGDAPDPYVHYGHIVRYRFRKAAVQGGHSLTVGLYEGEVLIESWTHENITDAWVTAEQTISEENAAQISNYDNLQLQFMVTE
jgi:hypothetical protein